LAAKHRPPGRMHDIRQINGLSKLNSIPLVTLGWVEAAAPQPAFFGSHPILTCLH
jgi:hypothetical protein